MQFFIFQKFHFTIDLIRKDLRQLSGFLDVPQTQGQV